MQRELERLQYGNCDISDWEGRLNTNNSNRALTGFWIESSLMISPKEQAEVMERIFGENSAYSEETQNQLKQVMLAPGIEGADISIYGKTGMGKADGVVVDAWFTGFAERAAGDIYFCVRLGRTDDRDVSSSLAKEIAIKVVLDSILSESGQAAGNLKITAEGAPVEVRLASDGQYSYEYDKDKYTVTTTMNGSTFEIKAVEMESGANMGEQSNVIIRIPNQDYTQITGVAEGGSLILPAINANIIVTSNAGSVVLSLPSDYNKTLNYTGNASACSLSMNGIYDFAVRAKISASSVQTLSDWPVYGMLCSDYSYTSGEGTAKINMDITGSSFTFN